jgi:WD40 repeat protein
MSLFRFALGLFVAALWSVPLFAQVQKAPPVPTTQAAWAGAGALPAGARLRLGNGGALVTEHQGAATLSPDAKYLAIANTAQSVTLFDLASGKQVAQISSANGGAGFPPLLGFSADGKKLGFGGFGGLNVAEIPSGKLLRQIVLTGPQIHQSRAISFSADGRFVTLGTGYPGGTQQRPSVWEVATGKASGPYDVLQNATIWTALSPDGKMLATGGQHFARGAVQEPEPPQTIQLWDVATAKEVRRFKTDQPFTQVSGAVFAPDGKTLAAASGQATFHLFDVATGRELRRFAGRRSQTSFLCFAPDGSLFVAGGSEGALQIWQTATGRRLDLPAAPRTRLLSVGFPGDGRIIALGVLGQALTWWDAVSGKIGFVPYGHHLPVHALAFAPDGKTLTSAGSDGQVFWWDTATGTTRRRLKLVDEEISQARGTTRYNALALSADGRALAASSTMRANSVRLWNLEARRPVCDFEASRAAYPLGLAFSASGAKLAVASANGANVWDVQSGQEAARLSFGPKEQNHGGNTFHPVLSPGGTILAVPITAYNPNTNQQTSQVLILDTGTGKEMHALTAPANSYNLQTAFSPDGKLLALGGQGVALSLFKTASGKEWLRFRQEPSTLHQQRTALAFAPHGRTLALATQGYQTFDFFGRPRPNPAPTIDVWELASGSLRQRFEGHRGLIQCLAFSPDGQSLASGSSDTTVLLWDTSGRGPTSTLSPSALAETWPLLESPDAKAAFRAMGRLLAAPAEALALLREHLQPAPANEAERAKVQTWLSALDSDSFASRDEAFRGLERLGPIAEPALQRALASDLSLEVRRRVGDLLARLDRGTPGPKEIRIIRAVEVLERLGPQARALLGALAQGDEAALLTQEARKALGRISQ